MQRVCTIYALLTLSWLLAAAGTATAMPVAQPSGKIAGIFSVQLTLVPGCTINGGASQSPIGTVDFGIHPKLTDIVTAQLASVTLNCPSNLAYSITLDNGLNVDAHTQRRMGSTAHGGGGGNSGPYITYNLYQDAAHQTLWTSAVSVSGTGSGANAPVNIYATVPSQTTPQEGTYQDSVTMTISW
ncbi:MAG: Csu type fimbrial protein [Enterobacteriaceae bacterium]